MTSRGIIQRTDRTIADRLEALAGDYDRQAAEASNDDQPDTSGPPVTRRSGEGEGAPE
jgi:hypothetical protein